MTGSPRIESLLELAKLRVREDDLHRGKPIHQHGDAIDGDFIRQPSDHHLVAVFILHQEH
eukprot:16157007-Heterocapsa_arctica.AAC.1